ncbi:ComF family protein [Allonocardiopsis opalescens]|uniref:Putative amidophosphoribosyltransferase n=1 Tax=Allonocardiopsis opalescens TaxID=1144618 RepID=A0A2T0QC75_9ACTN|nr:phosphoribosyltransferase family protein [Allonocardiopsis opalescens]PRY01519.1 putative amidophosphoribosyltransferase [Allonocardiopsis opalescens]
MSSAPASPRPARLPASAGEGPPLTPTGLPAAAADLVLLRRCAGCGRHGPELCPACLDELAAAPRRCGPRRTPGCPPCWTLTGYGGTGRSVVLALKERGRHRLAAPMGRALAHAVRAALAATGASAPAEPGRPPRRAAGVATVRLVPVPPRLGARLRRGYDPVGAMAAEAARALSADGRTAMAAPALRHRRPGRDQVGLDARARHANLHGALAVRGRWRARLAGRPVLLVDDVATSGATLAEAARALRAAGADVRAAITFAVA